MAVSRKGKAERDRAPQPTSTSAKLARVREMREQARLGGGPSRIEQQHARKKLTARERLELLLDPDSFEETDAFATHR